MNTLRMIWRPALTDEIRAEIRRLEREQVLLALESYALEAKRTETEQKLSFLTARLAVEESVRG